jgi:hypothetical protein
VGSRNYDERFQLRSMVRRADPQGAGKRGSLVEIVPNIPFRLDDLRLAGILFDFFFAQIADAEMEVFQLVRVFRTPDLEQKGAVGNDAPAVARQVGEQMGVCERWHSHLHATSEEEK